MSTPFDASSQPSSTSAPSRWRRRLGLALCLVFMLTVGLLVWIFPLQGQHSLLQKKPDASCLVLIRHPSPTVFSDLGQRTEPSAADLDVYRQTQAALVRSRHVLDAALSRPEVAELKSFKQHPDPAAWLQEHLQVDFPQSPQIMRIGISGTDANELRVLVKAVAGAYLEEAVNSDRHNIYQRLETLKGIAKKYDEAIKLKQEQMKRRITEGAMDPHTRALEQQLLPQELTECRRELRQVKLARAAAQAKLNSQQADKKGLEAELAVLAEKEKVLAEEEKQLLAKAVRLATNELNELQADVARAEQMLKRIQDEAEALRLQLQAPARVVLVQDVVVNQPK